MGTWARTNAGMDQLGFVRGPARILAAPPTPAATVAETTPGTGQYDPVGSWFDLGATKNGIVPTMNNTEDEFTIDQQKVAIGVLPNEWTWSFTTSLVEVTPENLATTWDMGA